MIARDISKQQAIDADPEGIRQLNFTPNLDRFFKNVSLFLKKQKKLFWAFHKEP